MRFRLVAFVGIAALGSLMLLAACGGGSNSSSTATGGTTQETSTSTSVSSPGTTSPVASPGTAVATPSVSPSGSPTGGAPISLGTAFSNLESQQSYVLTMDVSGLSGLAAMLPNAGNSQKITLTRSGNDRHLVVEGSNGNKVGELWRVDDQTYVDIGTGPMEVGQAGGIANNLVPLLDAPSAFIKGMSADENKYEVTGTDTVDGVDTTVQKASYQVEKPSGTGMMTPGPAMVDSTMWVATDGGYLVKLEMNISQSGGTPTSGESGAKVTANVTQVGSAPEIKAPTQ